MAELRTAQWALLFYAGIGEANLARGQAPSRDMCSPLP